MSSIDSSDRLLKSCSSFFQLRPSSSFSRNFISASMLIISSSALFSSASRCSTLHACSSTESLSALTFLSFSTISFFKSSISARRTWSPPPPDDPLENPPCFKRLSSLLTLSKFRLSSFCCAANSSPFSSASVNCSCSLTTSNFVNNNSLSIFSFSSLNVLSFRRGGTGASMRSLGLVESCWSSRLRWDFFFDVAVEGSDRTLFESIDVRDRSDRADILLPLLDFLPPFFSFVAVPSRCFFSLIVPGDSTDLLRSEEVISDSGGVFKPPPFRRRCFSPVSESYSRRADDLRPFFLIRTPPASESYSRSGRD